MNEQQPQPPPHPLGFVDLDSHVLKGFSSARIVPTAMCVSKQHLVFGASSGSLYIFDRATMGKVELYTHPDVRAAVTCCSVSPDGCLVAFAGRGQSFVIARITRGPIDEERCVYACGTTGTLLCLEWSSDGTTVYHGYQSGEVMHSYVTQSVFGGPKKYVSELVARSVDAVVQLSCSLDGKRLLISTSSKTSLYDFEKKSVRAVGKQAVRSGPYGSVYHPHLPGFFLASRPGNRLWLVQDETAAVIKTLPLAQSLAEAPDLVLVAGKKSAAFDALFPLDDDDTEVSGGGSDSDSSSSSQIMMFGKLLPFSASSLVAWGETGLYLINLETIVVSHAFREAHVVSCCCCASADETEEELYVLLSNGSSFLLAQPERLLVRLCDLGLNAEACRVWSSLRNRATILSGKLSRAAVQNMISAATDATMLQGLQQLDAALARAAVVVTASMELLLEEVQITHGGATTSTASASAAVSPPTAELAPSASVVVVVSKKKKKTVGRKSSSRKSPEPTRSLSATWGTSAPGTVPNPAPTESTSAQSTGSDSEPFPIAAPRTAPLPHKETDAAEDVTTATAAMGLSRRATAARTTDSLSPIQEEASTSPALKASSVPDTPSTTLADHLGGGAAGPVRAKGFREASLQTLQRAKSIFAKATTAVAASTASTTIPATTPTSTTTTTTTPPPTTAITTSSATTIEATSAPAASSEDDWVKQAHRAALQACCRACNGWRGLSLRPWATTSADMTLVERALNTGPYQRDPFLLASALCLSAEQAHSSSSSSTWFFGPERSREEWLKSRAADIFRSDRAVEACVAASLLRGWSECVEILRQAEATALTLTEQRRNAIAAAAGRLAQSEKSQLLDGALTALCSTLPFPSGSLLLWRFGLLFPALDLMVNSIPNKRFATECALRWPALTEDSVRAALLDSRTPAAESWKLSYLVELCTLHPRLWTIARMEEMLILAASTRPPLADVFNALDPTLPCAGALAPGVWPLDTLMFSMCVRARGSGELDATCRRIGYWRGIVDVDPLLDEDGSKLRLCVFAHHTEKAISIMEGWCGTSAQRWAAALAVVQDAVRIDCKCPVTPHLVYERIVEHVRPLTEAAALLSDCGDNTLALKLVFVDNARRLREESAFSLLESVDAHLWTKRNVHVVPQAVAIARLENTPGSDALFAPFMGSSGLLALDSSVVTLRSFEDTSNHWGSRIAIHKAACPVCTFPLAPSPDVDMARAQAVRVFRCGHAIHMECSPEEACVVCFVDRFKKLQSIGHVFTSASTTTTTTSSSSSSSSSPPPSIIIPYKGV